jgi:hypothetical protein
MIVASDWGRAKMLNRNGWRNRIVSPAVAFLDSWINPRDCIRGIGIFSLDNSTKPRYCPSFIHLLGELDRYAAADGGKSSVAMCRLGDRCVQVRALPDEVFDFRLKGWRTDYGQRARVYLGPAAMGVGKRDNLSAILNGA